MSSSEGLRIKSTKALFKVFVGKAGGSSSTAQNRFLAKPCWSRVPWLPNCKQRANFLDHVLWNVMIITKKQFLDGHLQIVMILEIDCVKFSIT